MGSASSFIDHLKELRRRVFYSAIAITLMSVTAFYFYDPLFLFFSKPFLSISSSISQPLVVHSVLEGFVTKMKFSFLFGLILSSPFLMFHGLRFVVPGLEKTEKRVLILALVASVLLSGISFYLSYFYLLPFALGFLTSANFIPETVGVLLNYQQSIFYAFNVMVFMVLLFQTPIILELLLYMNLVSRKALLKHSRYVIVLIFLVSAIVTPPDIITQLGLSLPLIGMYFLTIGIAKVFNWGTPHV